MPVLSSKRVLRQVRDYTCKGCAKQPRARLTKSELTVPAGKRLQLQCKVQGKPTPMVKWFLDGTPIPPDDRHYVISRTKRGSRMRIRKAKQADGGLYSCQALSAFGQSDLAMARASVLPVGKKNLHHELCKQQTYCLNGGVCYEMTSLAEMYCECKEPYAGPRCSEKRPDPSVTDIIRLGGKRDSHSQDRTRTITGLVIGAIVLALICIISYFLARKKKTEFHKRKAKKRAEKDQTNNGSVQPLLQDASNVKLRAADSRMQHTNRGVDMSVQTEVAFMTPSPSDDSSLPPYDHKAPSRHLPRQNTAPSRLQVPEGGRPRLNGISITPDLPMYRPPPNVAVVNAIVEPDREAVSPDEDVDKLSEYAASDLEVNMESEADVAGLDASDDDVDNGRHSMELLTPSDDEVVSTTSDSSIGEEIALFQQLARNPRVPSTPSHTSQNSLTWPSDFATPNSPILSSPRQPPPPYIHNNGTHHLGGQKPRSLVDDYDPRAEFPFPYDPDPDATVV